MSFYEDEDEQTAVQDHRDALRMREEGLQYCASCSEETPISILEDGFCSECRKKFFCFSPDIHRTPPVKIKVVGQYIAAEKEKASTFEILEVTDGAGRQFNSLSETEKEFIRWYGVEQWESDHAKGGVYENHI